MGRKKGIPPALIPVLIFLCFSSLCAEEITCSFDSAGGLEMNPTNMRCRNGRLTLSPTGWFWTNTGIIMPETSLPVCLFQDSKKNLFYGTTQMGPSGNIYRSTNYGNDWTSVFNYSGNEVVEGPDRSLYANTGNGSGTGLVKSFDGGASWASLISGGWGNALMKDRSDYLYASINRYNAIFPVWGTNWIYKSYNQGTNWFIVKKEGDAGSTASPNFFWMDELENGSFLAGQSDFGSITNGVTLSTNQGTNWQNIPSAVGYFLNGILHGSDNRLYVYGSDGLIVSENGGLTWNLISSNYFYALKETDDGIFYAAIRTNIRRSYDRGNSWQELPPLMKNGVHYGSYLGNALIQADDGKIYAGGAAGDWNNGYIFKSGYVTAATAFVSFSPDEVRKWTDYSVSYESGGGLSLDFMSSSNNGMTWSGLLPLTRDNLEQTHCTGKGSDRIKVRIIMNSPDHNLSPSVDQLTLMYESGIQTGLGAVSLAPNPFYPKRKNHRHIVFFNLTREFELHVFTVTGALVTGVKGRSEAGQYAWDAKDRAGRDLKPGIYHCRITAPSGEVKTLKLAVIR